MIIREQIFSKGVVIGCFNFCKIGIKELFFYIPKLAWRLQNHFSFIMSEPEVPFIWIQHHWASFWCSDFNWIPLMAMLKSTLVITIVAKTAISTILAMAKGVINMATLGIQLISIKTRSAVLDFYQSDLPFRHFQYFWKFVIFMLFSQCRNSNSLRYFWK